MFSLLCGLYKWVAARDEVPYATEPQLRESDFSDAYPRYPDVRRIALSPAERRAWVDLRPYMDATPCTVHMHAPVERAHRLFLAMGLRHLLVTNDAADCVGLLTRHELVEHRLVALWDALDAQAATRAKEKDEEAEGGSDGATAP